MAKFPKNALQRKSDTLNCASPWTATNRGKLPGANLRPSGYYTGVLTTMPRVTWGEASRATHDVLTPG
eukprot:CAMPEP_0204387660 /NCGR_PEP_ID=MMETSP0469-20131031/59076_1 /ASSEMBLY_ACC=CAM_ASM_000384 /TAXON_ID=2969 /ORGANISM="Oxyrrhis marina" /LENGTH=67 /DNA_ID=CAMNT_0051381061 /DNA_START=39 /DNA_END=242 /DNA_ORIENTATION=+